MKSNFERSVAAVLAHEGGYSDHPADPGGATNRGITIATLRSYRGRNVTKDDVRALSEREARAIYKARYWDTINADDLPAGIDHALFDVAVNSGVGRAHDWSYLAVGEPRAAIRAICGARMDYLKRLKTWPTFGRGWTARVKRVEREALAMADGVAWSPAPQKKPMAGKVVTGGSAVVLGGGAAIQAGVPPLVVLLILAAIAGAAAFFILRKR